MLGFFNRGTFHGVTIPLDGRDLLALHRLWGQDLCGEVFVALAERHEVDRRTTQYNHEERLGGVDEEGGQCKHGIKLTEVQVRTDECDVTRGHDGTDGCRWRRGG